MNLNLTDCPRIHFVGIAGAGMSGLARYLIDRGYIVSGSDQSLGSVGEELRDLGASVSEGHNARFGADADLVVISSAVRDDNPEVVAARTRGTPVIKRAELLGTVMNPHRGIAVAGTHGKSTTSALIGHLLTVAQCDPTILIGAVSDTLGSNARVGASDLVVVEADEYDASFHQLRPEVGVILNVEAEHLDFYGSTEAVFAAFRQFARSVTGVLVVCVDDVGARDMLASTTATTVTYGIGVGEWRAEALRQEADGTHFVAARGLERITVVVPLAGLHSVRNALAAIAVARYLEVAPEVVARGLATFRGVHRRLQLRGEVDGVLVVDDYAHHPTEMVASLGALRGQYPERRVLLVFQPHTYSRTQAFFSELAAALCDADRVYVMDIYAAREHDTLGMHSRNLAARAEQLGASARYTGDLDATLAAVRRDVRSGDMVVAMGAGDVYRVADELLAAEGVTV